MIDNVILNKVDFIKKCTSRINKEFDKDFKTNNADGSVRGQI